MIEKHPSGANLCFQLQNKRLKYLGEKLPLSKSYVTSEGAFSHNVLYYQQLSISRYQVCFYANNLLGNYQ